MSQQSASRTPRSASFNYSWDKPLALRWYRDAVFDNISHTVALQILTVCRPAHWLHYYQAPVLLPEQVDALYCVEPKTTDRLIRNFEAQLTSDGLFACPETFVQHSEPVLGLCWIGKPHLNYLLPPRAVLKLACWMPATQATIWALGGIDAIASKPCEPLPEQVRMSQHYKVVERRTAPKDKIALVAEAQELGLYAYAKHFGDLKSGITYSRLLTHYERSGQFPPTRQELNDLLVEF
ncbi:hypothetical protein QUB11_00880 [Microcoleus sp. B6-A1]|uniref:hypothetical protein n=1 Tax=Microcoleus sp. B6-A1 TaxID=2818684 RepID=UPI002FD79527